MDSLVEELQQGADVAAPERVVALTYDVEIVITHAASWISDDMWPKPQSLQRGCSRGKKFLCRLVRYHGRMQGDVTVLPGGDVIQRGLDDRRHGLASNEALLVSIGAPRLRQIGIEVPDPLPNAERQLYDRLHAEDADAAHSRYNALVRRLVSFERAAACAS